MRILGIDPGSVICGYGVIESQGSSLQLVEYGVVEMKRRSESFPLRLREIYDRLTAVMSRTRPEVCALEAVFFAKNARSLVQLSQARGVAILVCAQSGLEPVQYTPMQVKRCVTGRGSATKPQVSAMVQAILGLEEAPTPYDATDALAIAICHAVHGGTTPEPVRRSKKKGSRQAWSDFVRNKF